MCKHGTYKKIYVIRRANPSISDGWHPIFVDSCIADYVQKMNKEGIITVGCCCGHGEHPAEVLISYDSLSQLQEKGYEYHLFSRNRYDIVSHYVGLKVDPKIYQSFPNHNL